MNRLDLSARLSERSGLTVRQSAMAVSALIDAISDALADGDDVNLHGFGSFRARKRTGRETQHPSNMERLAVPSGWRVTFSAAPALKRRLSSAPESDENTAS